MLEQLPTPLAPKGEPNETLALMRLATLRAEKEKLLRIREVREKNGLAFYRPHLKQHKFHVTQAQARYLRTGNRFGKSECGIAEDIAQCMGGRIWYRETFDILNGKREVAEHHVGSYNHPYVTVGLKQYPIKALILVVDWDMAKKIFTNREGSYDVWGKLWKLIPADAVGKISTGGRGDRIVSIEIKRPTEFGGGVSTLAFDTIESYKHNKLGAESADHDLIHVDEPVPEGLYDAHARGLMDRNGVTYFTCTPLDQMWINDRFCPPGQRVVKDADAGVSFDSKFIITGSTHDNPHRNDEGVATFEKELSREAKQCRIYGLPLGFAGLVYKEFIYDLHVLCDIPNEWESYDNPPLDYTIRVAWDVHQRLPQALLIAATAPNGVTFICKEMFDDSKIEPNAKALSKWLQGRNVIDLIIDPFAVNPDPRDDSTILDDLWAEELFFEKASKDLTLGISRVSERLLERTPAGLPTICFSPELTETLFEFSHYIFDSDKNKPKDKDDHMMENLYRLVLNGLGYVSPNEDSTFKSKPLIVSHAADLQRFSHPGSLLR